MSANLDALRLLFPLELRGDHDADLEIDARSLDRVQASAETLLAEMFPDTALTLLPARERVLGLTPGPDDPLQFRRDLVLRKIRDRGGLSIPYFTDLAATLGYAIAIIEPIPSMVGWTSADDELVDEAANGQWGVEMPSVPLYYACADETCADEPLLWWTGNTPLEDLLTELKPAHTFVYFSY